MTNPELRAEEIARFRRAFRGGLADKSDAEVARLRGVYEAEAVKANPHHYTFVQPDGTCFSLSAADVWEAHAKALSYLSLPAFASLCRYSEDIDTPAKMRAALRKSQRMYGSK